MARRTIKQIAEALDNARTVSLPIHWFDDLRDNISVFDSLYKWLVHVYGVEIDLLHNRTFVGKTTMKKLLAHEKERIKRVHGLKGEELESAVRWSNMGSGPMESFAQKIIEGEGILIVSEKDKNYQDVQFSMFMADMNVKNKKIRSRAAGKNFYEWLVANVGREDRVGDLAYDTLHDKDFPKTIDSYRDASRYLARCRACDGAMSSLGQAWSEYVERYPNRDLEDIDTTECTECLEILSECVCIKYCDVCNYEEDECECENTGDDDVEASCNPISFVYFIESIGLGQIKIGVSDNPRQRLKQLSTGSPYKLELIKTIPGTVLLERVLHAKFSHIRANGEWFYATNELREYIESHGDQTK